MDCSPPDSSVHGILQARIQQWVAIPFSRGSSQPRIEPGPPALPGCSLLSEPPGEPCVCVYVYHRYFYTLFQILSPYQFSSVVQVCPTLCDPMDCSTPDFPVHHQLREFTQTHVHWVGDAIQPSHPLSSPSPPAFNLSQHQGLFQWVSSSHQVAKLLELQHQSFQGIFRTDFLQDWLVLSPYSPGDSQESSPTPQFKSVDSLSLNFLYGPYMTCLHPYMTTRKTIYISYPYTLLQDLEYSLCATQQVIIIYFIYYGVYMLIPNS